MSIFRALISVFLILGVILGALAPTGELFAQELSPSERAALQAEYDQTLREIEEVEKTIDGLKQQQKTITGDISLLTAQINQAEAVLRQKNLTIKTISGEINQKTQKINTLNTRIERGRVSLAELIRRTRELDSYSLAEAVLSDEDFSDFFADFDSFSAIQKDLQVLFFSIREAKAETEKEKQALAQKKDQEEDAKYVIETKKKEVAKNEAEKKQLLAVVDQTKAVQDSFLAQKQAKAEQIRAALFGLRDSEGIPFGTALEYANVASQKTGVRAALILAILSQESDLGKNVGSCYVKNLDTGDGVGKNTGNPFQQVMKAPRDTVPFQRITSAVGREWSMTPVSCPLGAVYVVGRGFGGAMGPSQFIPSTWEIFRTRIASAVGVKEPNPWNAQHAIIATAIYLKDLGAAGGTYTAERNASCRYYSGRACDNKKPANTFYGNQVLVKAAQFQENIDFLRSI